MQVVITGATKGIGRALASAFAALGAQLAVCSRHVDQLQELQRDLENIYPDCKVFYQATDMAVPEQVLAFAKFVSDHFDATDVLINNVGGFIPEDVTTSKAGSLEKLMQLNVFAAHNLTHALLPAMLSQNTGHIFNMCSIASLGARANSGLYVVTKFALLGFSKSLRYELQDKGIKVTAVLPGPTWSAAWEGADFPADRLLPPEDVARAVVCAYQMGPHSVLEELIIQPQKGDI